MNPDILRELREWAALGYYASLQAGDPWPISMGKAWRALYENMDIVIPDDRLLVPCEPVEYAQPWSPEIAHDMGAMGVSRILCPESCLGMKLNRCMVEPQKKRFPQHAAFIDGLYRDLQERIGRHIQLVHSSFDMERILGEGVLAMERELDEEIAKVRAEGDTADAEERNLLEAVKEYVRGVKAFHRRACEAADAAVARASGDRRRKLGIVARALRGALLTPAHSFVEGLVAINFAWMLDGCDNIGRLDQLLGERFERDRADGTLDLELARELLDDLWLYFHQWNGWQIQIGGYIADGKDGCNALTRECLLACERNPRHKPSVSLRVNRDTPEDVVLQAFRCMRLGAGQPALYNDERYLTNLAGAPMNIPAPDLYRYGFGGCTEVLINGLSNIGSHTNRPDMNVSWALEWALHNGLAPRAKGQEGLRTGPFESFATFGDFLAALKRQLKHLTEHYVKCVQLDGEAHAALAPPMLHRTFFTGDCVRRRTSFLRGGARYNWNYVNYVGISNVIDSAAAIRHCVFDSKSVSAAELMDALRADFEGHEATRLKLAAAPKFGNDDPYVDDLAAELVEFMWSGMLKHEAPRGGRFIPSSIPHLLHGGYGRRVGSTPDGRRAGMPLGDSIGAFQGRDRRGPTALLKSVTSLPLHLAIATPVLNVRFEKAMLSTDAGRRRAASLVRAYFAEGGMHVQVSVLDREELLAAKKEPEKFANLIVRIGGYSEYFIALSEEMKDGVIARTEHV